MIRTILEAAGVGDWVQTSHLNSRGAHKISAEDVVTLFRSSSAAVLSSIIDRFYPDFTVCGYHDTLAELKKLLRRKL